jgi:hypothetical protein
MVDLMVYLKAELMVVWWADVTVVVMVELMVSREVDELAVELE